MSSAQWERLSQFIIGLHSSAASACLCIFLFRLVRSVLSLHSTPPQTQRSMQKQKGKILPLQAGWVFNPATSAHTTQEESTKTHEIHNSLWNDTRLLLQRVRSPSFTSLKHTCCLRRLLGNTVVLGAKYILHTVNM